MGERESTKSEEGVQGVGICLHSAIEGNDGLDVLVQHQMSVKQPAKVIDAALKAISRRY